MRITTIAMLFICIFGTSCCTSSKTQQKAKEENATLVNSKKMMEEGYIKGTIVASKAEGDCPYVIQSEIDGNIVMYDPINLEDDYKKAGMVVWYKYNPLRMMNRCEKANPVNIQDIEKAI